MKYKIVWVLMLMLSGFSFAQTTTDTIKTDTLKVNSGITKIDKSEVEVLDEINKKNAPQGLVKYSPMKAGLYSAVLPGLGQYYNKKYWKIPIVWGAVGTGVGIALWNQKNYNRYRNAFVAELNGQPHEFSNIPGVDKTVLGNAQDQYKRQRDYAIGIAGLIYILNIVDAVVDAHLFEGRKDPDLAISPTVIPDQYSVQPTKAGLSFNYRF
ncbi:DUF5683 domain-containing protein [Soonwooa sp.]|uniref:DUF5683 domain-containing protein n=1 Tax=Soonwooa sp. TaxID=1938592 RepID=UPI0028A9D9DB|nr:DUF5683 domain-containing protein [Soonwooa sp.]